MFYVFKKESRGSAVCSTNPSGTFMTCKGFSMFLPRFIKKLCLLDELTLPDSFTLEFHFFSPQNMCFQKVKLCFSKNPRNILMCKNFQRQGFYSSHRNISWCHKKYIYLSICATFMANLIGMGIRRISRKSLILKKAMPLSNKH